LPRRFILRRKLLEKKIWPGLPAPPGNGTGPFAPV